MIPDKLCQIVRCSNLQNWHNLENDDDKSYLYNFSDPKNNIHSVQICINSRWQTKNKMGQLLSKFLKRAQEKQSESLSQLCTITVYGEGAALLSKPREYSFRAAAREKWVTF